MMVAWKRLGSRVAQDVLSNRCLRERVETEPVAFAKELQRCKLFLAKHGDDPIQRNTARAPDKFGVHEFTWHNLCRRYGPIGTSADWTLVRHYYIATMSCRWTRGWELNPNSPEDPALIVRSQLTAWTAELELLLQDPQVQKFAELREKIDEAGAFLVEANAEPLSNRLGPPRGMGNGVKRIGLGIPDNELSALKADDLEDLAVRTRPIAAR